MNTENERKKEYLRRYIENTRKVNRITAEIEEIKSLQMNPSLNTDGMPHAHNGNNDLSDYIIRLQQREKDLKIAQEEQVKSYEDISERIGKLKDSDENDVLFYRYIKDMTWWDISKQMHFSESGIYKLHGRALRDFQINEEGSK